MRNVKQRVICASAACILGAAQLTGCGPKEAGQETAAQTESETAVSETAAQVPNPMEEVTNEQDFEKIGVHMVTPDGAENPHYFIIAQEVAEIQFTTKDGAAYSFRASSTAEDFAGIFERFTDKVISRDFKYAGGSVEVQIKTTESGGRVAFWAWGSTRYTLYTASQVSDKDITDFTMKLVELSQHE